MKGNNSKNIEKVTLNYVNYSRKKVGLNELHPARGLIFLARRHSNKMMRRGKIWHGNNVIVASEYVLKDGEISIFEQIIILFLKIFSLQIPVRYKFRGISGENVAMMPIGRVKGFHKEISTDKDIAKALHITWMNSHGHRANILNPNFKLLGVGIKRKGKMTYATELFFG